MISTTTHRRALAALATAAIATGAGAPVALAQPTDQVMPPPSSIAASAATEYQQLRTPDRQDLRMPDTQDAANAYHPVLDASTSTATGSDGFDVPSAAIGAAAGAGLGILALGLGGVARRRPRAGHHRPVGA